MVPWLITLSLCSVASMSTMKEGFVVPRFDVHDDAHLDDSHCPVHGIGVDGFGWGGAFNDAGGDKSDYPKRERICPSFRLLSLLFGSLFISAHALVGIGIFVDLDESGHLAIHDDGHPPRIPRNRTLPQQWVTKPGSA